MEICGIQKLTLLDFPGKTASTVFTGGCNLRCPFCHNASLAESDAEPLDTEEITGFLKKRANILEGVCVTGGEPLLQPDLADFLRFVRSLGLAVKLDTNGTLPKRLALLLDEGLLDYVAMDLKNCPEMYAATVGTKNFNFENVAETMALLRASSVDYEYRTTVVKGLHTKEGLIKAAGLIKPHEKWYLQQFVDSGDLIDSSMEGYTPEEMRKLHAAVLPYVPTVKLRGI